MLQAFVDIEGYPNPSIITGDEQQPDCFTIVKSDTLLLLKLTDGFETNIKNFDRKAKRYQQLLAELSNKYKVFYVNFEFGCYWYNRERQLDNDCDGKVWFI